MWHHISPCDYPGTPRAKTALRSVLSNLYIALAFGCGDPTAPQATIAISATVDGVPWRPGGGGAPPPYATLYQGDQVLAVGGLYSRSTPYRSEQILLSLNHVTGPGSYALGDPGVTSSGLYTVWQGLLTDPGFSVTSYFTSAAVTGTVVLSQLDPATHAIAGSFSFEAESASGGRVAITAGSFHGHYDPNPPNGARW